MLILIVQQLPAFTYYEQLCAFNPNWKKYPERVPYETARIFTTDKEYIQAHLGTVLSILKSETPSKLNSKQLNARKLLIGILEDYRLKGNFPINYFRNERIPVFIDPNGTHCAVGYLLQQTGKEDLVLRIAAADNYIWVKDIKDRELLQWQLQSGLTLEELKLIQGAYDSYMPRALELPNKYEIPQKPACSTLYFVKNVNSRKKAKPTKYIWLKGEGENGVLNGRWEQNFGIGVPWIIGYYDHGKRTGQWLEYYKGTNKICRTEIWENDKLNGIRKRYDISGKLIEEIYFQDGIAVTKTNYDFKNGLTWVRKPIDSAMVYTKVFNSSGVLTGKGHETVYNPGNLLWFQNIELTALNSASITSRDISIQKPRPFSGFANPFLYNTPPLVEYKKQGDWIYYSECIPNNLIVKQDVISEDFFKLNYKHFGKMIFQSVKPLANSQLKGNLDSLKIVYNNDRVLDFFGYGTQDYVHLHIRYFKESTAVPEQETIQYYRTGVQPVRNIIRETGQYNRQRERIGTWNFYNTNGILYKTEQYFLPQKEENEIVTITSLSAPGWVWALNLNVKPFARNSIEMESWQCLA
jgi:antitoxin component YwqK of YwqJK toxin-antitoxin module